MKALIQNEILGTIALQETLAHMPQKCMPLPNVLFVLPLLFNKKIRNILKDKRVKFRSLKDLIVSYPEAFLSMPNLYLDSTLSSVNTLILAIDVGMIGLNEGQTIILEREIPGISKETYGLLAAEISLAAPNAAKILQEPPCNLFLNFGVSA